MDQALQSQIDEANQLLTERKYDEVTSLVQPLLIRETGGQAQRVYGMALLGLGKYQEAVHLLMTAAQLLPDDVTVAFAYGSAMNQNGQTEGARASFARALTINADHPGAKVGFLNTSKALADKVEATEPMKAIEWLYDVWQRDPGNAELAHRILDIYVKNGWSDSAHQFGALLPPALKNSEAMRAKLKALPSAAPPVNPANIPAPGGTMAMGASQAPVFEACPFCKQQIMLGVHTCPHCKMIIRAKAMPGADYKPDWQEIVLNILCWIGLLLNAFQVIQVFIAREHATPGGGFTIAMGLVSGIANVFILQRNDFWMSIAKWLYLMGCIRSGFCACTSMGLIGSTAGDMKNAAMVLFVFLIIQGAYCGFMVYLLNHEGAD